MRLLRFPIPIVVVLDDIDRLSTAEIRDVFKLVRLTASFPNLIYVLAFDRVRVEDALAEQGISGRAYLEKILQLAVDLPAVPEQVLTRQIGQALDAALESIEDTGPFDESAWPDLFMEIVRPLVRNMRDVRRYAAAAHGTVRALDGQIELGNLLAIEAVRVFLPDVFRLLPDAVPALTHASDALYGERSSSEQARAIVEGLIEQADDRQSVVRALIQRVFPAASRYVGGMHYGADFQRSWLKDRRLAHEQHLRMYLERFAGDDLRAFLDAERAWKLLRDRTAFERLLATLDVDRLEDVIASLENYEHEFGPEHTVSGVIVLLNELPRLPERQRGLSYLDARTVVGRVIFRLLRAAGDHAAVAAASERILPEINSLYCRRELLTTVGYRENAGHELVDRATAARMERAWRSEVRHATAKALAAEPDLLRTLFFAGKDADSDEDTPDIPDDPAITLALLRSARSDTHSQTLGSRAVRSKPRLAWDTLVTVFDSEDALTTRIDAVREASSEEDAALLELAARYQAGWRPNDFDRD